MDEAARKKFCNLIMFDIAPPNPKTAGRQMPIMVDYTTSLETSCMQNNDNFVLTSFVEPMKVQPSNNCSNKKLPCKVSTDSNTPPPCIPATIFVDESNMQKSKSELQAQRAPRPPNAFILYRRAKQPGVIKQLGHTSNARLSQILAEMWKNEPEQVKYEWRKNADRKKMEHSHKYPGYIYRPKKSNASKKKNKRGNKSSTFTTNFEQSIIVMNSTNETSDVCNISDITNVPTLSDDTQTHNDDEFQAYLKKSWEEYKQQYQQNTNFPEQNYSDINHPIGQLSDRQVNTQFSAEQYQPFPQIYDYPEDQLTSQVLIANLDPYPRIQ